MDILYDTFIQLYTAIGAFLRYLPVWPQTFRILTKFYIIAMKHTDFMGLNTVNCEYRVYAGCIFFVHDGIEKFR